MDELKAIDIKNSVRIQKDIIVSRLVYKSDAVNVTVFAMACNEDINLEIYEEKVVYYCLRGMVAIYTDTNTLYLDEGQAVEIKPSMQHGINALSDSKIVMIKEQERK